MSKLESLYLRLGEPEGELSGCCEVAEWAADEIERLRDALSNIREQCERHPLFMGNDASIDEILAVGGDAAMITEIAQCARQALGKRP